MNNEIKLLQINSMEPGMLEELSKLLICVVEDGHQLVF
jgi:hypothetical protein